MYIPKCVCGMYSKILDTRFSDKINYACKKVFILVLAEVVHCFTRKNKTKKKEEKTWIKSNRRQENLLTVDDFQVYIYIYIYIYPFHFCFQLFSSSFFRDGGGRGAGRGSVNKWIQECA